MIFPSSSLTLIITSTSLFLAANFFLADARDFLPPTAALRAVLGFLVGSRASSSSLRFCNSSKVTPSCIAYSRIWQYVV